MCKTGIKAIENPEVSFMFRVGIQEFLDLQAFPQGFASRSSVFSSVFFFNSSSSMREHIIFSIIKIMNQVAYIYFH